MSTSSSLWAIAAVELTLFGLFWLATARLRVDAVRTGILTVAAFNLLMAAGLVLLALRPTWPNVLTVAGVDILVLLAMALLSHGGALQMKDTVRKDPFVILVLGSALILAFYYVWPNTNARIAVIFLGSSWIFLRSAWYASRMLHRDDQDPRMVNALRVIAVIAAAALIGRTVQGLLQRESLDLSIDSVQTEIAAFAVLIGLTMANSLLAYALVRSTLMELERTAASDPLTGLANRRAFWVGANRNWAEWQRHAKPFAVVCFDIDHFKSVNDTYGHGAGDDALKIMAEAMRVGSRPVDLIARMGGEEFVVLLSDVGDPTLSSEIANRIRESFSAMPLPASLQGATLTVSAGVAHADPSDTGMDKILQRADEALYAAKHSGRNRVCQAPAGTTGN